MIDFFSALASNTWHMIASMAPYLIMGFTVAGLLHVFMRPNTIQRLLGRPGIGSTLKACFIGVPIPLCSCSIIPVAASLRENGASRGATAAFVSSTPQTGIDSILATYSLMGSTFTAVRIAVAFISGIFTGFMIEVFCKENNNHSHFFRLQSKSECCNLPDSNQNKIVKLLRYGFVDLPSSLSIALLVGLALAGLITTLLPANLISGSLSSGPLAFLLATTISLPLYICATASIPMAYALITAGFSPGAALIFLITGPATNTATIVTMLKIIGRKATIIYLGSLLVISWLAGWLFNACISTQTVSHSVHEHSSSQIASWQHICGIALIIILLLSFYIKERSQKNHRTCCNAKSPNKT